MKYWHRQTGLALRDCILPPPQETLYRDLQCSLAVHCQHCFKRS